MKIGTTCGMRFGWAGAAVLILVLGLVAGCRSRDVAPRTDQQIATDIQAKIQADAALAGQGIQVSVADGVATLSGNVANDASRTLAAYDSSAIPGVKTVVNNLVVQAAPAPVMQAPPASAAAPSPQRSSKQTPLRRERSREQVAEAAPAPPSPVAQPAPRAEPVPAAVPAKPVMRQVTLAAGTIVPVRITETLTSKTAQPNDVFHGAVAADLGAKGVIAVPLGSPVLGRVVDAKAAARIKGSSLLAVELTELTARGQKLTLVTETYSKQGAGRGKDTAVKAGGGAAVGAIIGALAGGGKGAAIGGALGGAAGTGVNAATHGEESVIPTETVVKFRLQSPITVMVSVSPDDKSSTEEAEPQLNPR